MLDAALFADRLMTTDYFHEFNRIISVSFFSEDSAKQEKIERKKNSISFF